MLFEDPDFIENCEHYSIREGYCDLCGLSIGMRLEFEPDYLRNYTYIKPVQNHDTELKQVNCISQELREIVKENLKVKGKSIKKRRSKNVFCETYISGALIDEIKPEEIINLLNLSKKHVKDSMRIISGTNTKVVCDETPKTLQMVSISPLYLLTEICMLIDKSGKIIFPHIDNIRNLINVVEKISPSINNNRPKNLTIGFIKYYCVLNHINIGDISTITGISKPVINQMTSKIKKICISHNIINKYIL